MKRFQIHISLFLLGLFVFPQINNALHYFVVEHHFHLNNKDEKQFNHNDKNHNCQQSIFKIPSILLLDFGYTERIKTFFFNQINSLIFISFYKKNVFKILSDRGPPCKNEELKMESYKYANTLYLVV